ncbi:MAG TPA: sulfur carrier protein ThiS [Methylomirabilota bacterium]|nr:sulfur carrier protein ThiS [Methylomirabilota bacterium]
MHVIVNGDATDIPDGFTVTALLEHLRLRADRVAIELNSNILPKDRWPDTYVHSNDRFEIVQLVGGG